MSQTEYQIKPGNIKANSEETSTVSKISYEIENANNSGLKKGKINEQIEGLKEEGKFPKNLKYLKSYTDPNTGTTTTAFKNKDTGKVTLGMTGTNLHFEEMGNVLKHPFNHSDQARYERYEGNVERFRSRRQHWSRCCNG